MNWSILCGWCSLSFDSVDSVTDPLLEATWMRCKTYSSSTLDVRSIFVPSIDITYKYTTNVVIVSLCRNPDGFLWAGDTAQTISIGSTFRFNELGAFIYRYQACNSEVLYKEVNHFLRDRSVQCVVPRVAQKVSSYS